MALDNLSRFYNLTGVDPNIAQHGQSLEEIKLQKGAPDANPVASPMPATTAANALLALTPSGSDRMRLQGPAAPPVNPYAGAVHTLFLNRSALLKLDGAALGRISTMLQKGQVGTPQTQPLMGDSMARVGALKGLLTNLTDMAMSVVIRTRAVAQA